MKIGAVVIVLYLTTVEFLSGAQLNQRCITTGAPKLYKLYASCPSSSAAILNRAFGMKGQKEDKGEMVQTDIDKSNLETIQKNIEELQRNMSNQLKQNIENLQKNMSKNLNKNVENLRKHISNQLQENITNLQQNMSTKFEDIKVLIEKIQKNLKSARPNCDDFFNAGYQADGVKLLFSGKRLFNAYCEFNKSGHNWMVFQKRINGSVDFFRNWTSYENGFGNKNGEYWLGLQLLHEITSTKMYKLQVNLEDWNGTQAYAEYSSFSIGDRASNYKLSVSGYSGNAGDSLCYHNNSKFSSYDRDNDDWKDSCSLARKGAWWYRKCFFSNLNGMFGMVAKNRTGLVWYHWKNNYKPIKKSVMKIRPT